MKNVNLPDKLSDLLRLALSDLEACEKDQTYEIVMSAWHEPNEDTGQCQVCLAGAVLAQTFGAFPTEDIAPYSLGSVDVDRNVNKLYALDLLRRGFIDMAFDRLGYLLPTTLPKDVEVDGYKHGSSRFKTQMHVLADILEKAGC